MGYVPVTRRSGAGVGACILVAASSPWLGGTLAAALAAGFLIGGFLPPFLAVQALVTPARVRSLSFSFAAIYLVVGGAIFVALFGRVSDQSIRGPRLHVAVLGRGWSAPRLGHRFVVSDTTAAFADLAAGSHVAPQSSAEITDG